MCARGRAPEQHGRCNRRPVRRRSIRRYIPGWTAVGVATAERRGVFPGVQSSNSFFYLITAMHGLHLMGGLVALGRTTAKVWRGAEMTRVRLSVELCAIYWHFLLLIWLVLFGLLAGWAGDFIDICR